MPITPLTTAEEMRELLSAQGVLAWSDHNQDGAEDVNIIPTCVNFASTFIGGKLAKRFPLIALATAYLIREFATVIACRTLCMRRGNPIPDSLEMRYQEIVQRDGLLDQVANGTLPLIDDEGELIVGRGFAPTFSNLRVERRYPTQKIRVVQQTSSPAQSTQRRNFAGSVEVSDGR